MNKLAAKYEMPIIFTLSEYIAECYIDCTARMRSWDKAFKNKVVEGFRTIRI
jgi:hypothetical protein